MSEVILAVLVLGSCLLMFVWESADACFKRKKDRESGNTSLVFVALPLAGFLILIISWLTPINFAWSLVGDFVVFTAFVVLYVALLECCRWAGAATVRFVVRKTGYGIAPYHGYSMHPSFAIFGIMLIKYTNEKVPGIVTWPDRFFRTKDLRVGDIIVHRSKAGKSFTAHRIRTIDHHRRVLYTKGDNCDYIDPPVRFDQVYAKYVWHINLQYFGMLNFGAYWAYVRLYRKFKYGEPLFCLMPRYYVYYIPDSRFFEKEINFSRKMPKCITWVKSENKGTET